MGEEHKKIEIEEWKVIGWEKKAFAFWVLSHILDDLNQEKSFNKSAEEISKECHITADQASDAISTIMKCRSTDIHVVLNKDSFSPKYVCHHLTLKQLAATMHLISQGV